MNRLHQLVCTLVIALANMVSRNDCGKMSKSRCFEEDLLCFKMGGTYPVLLFTHGNDMFQIMHFDRRLPCVRKKAYVNFCSDRRLLFPYVRNGSTTLVSGGRPKNVEASKID